MPPFNFCAVDGCKSQKNNKNLSFFSLPVNETRRKRWLEIIGRPDLINPKTNPKCHFVCSLHFEKYMIICKPMLKPDAEPIKLLPTQQLGENALFVNGSSYVEESTQTGKMHTCRMRDASPETYPEVAVVKQENKEDETTFQSLPDEHIEVTVERIKQEYIEEETMLESIKHENRQTENVQTSNVPIEKLKEPRQRRKRKPQKVLDKIRYEENTSKPNLKINIH